MEYKRNSSILPFFRKGFNKPFENVGPRVGQGIDGMAHPVNEPSPVKGFFVEKVSTISGNPILIFPVGYRFLQIFKHLHDLYVGAAVLRPFREPSEAATTE
jgi:hypothetical protein